MAIIGYSEQRSLLETGDFRKKVYQAIIKAAVAIRNEDPNTDHHQSRVSLANAVVINPRQNEQRFSEVLATQMTSTNPSDSDIDGAMGAIWNSIALAMFPELQAPPPEEQGGGA